MSNQFARKNKEAVFMKVTPEFASKALASIGRQRTLRSAIVRRHADNMLAGAWVTTHQGISFNSQGELIDGQHRLAAVVMSGVTLDMLVTFGLNIGYGAPMDVGIKRTHADSLGLPVKLCSLLTTLCNLEMGDMSNVPSSIDVKNCYDRNVDAVDDITSGLHNNRYMRGPVAAAIVYAYPLAPDAVRNFGVQVLDGEMIQRGDPSFALRTWLKGACLVQRRVALATCNALRHHLSGNPLASIFTGTSGYQAITSQRRKRHIPHTPSSSVVPAYAKAITVEGDAS